MMKIPALLAILTLAAVARAAASTSLDDGWRFMRGDPTGAETTTFDDHQWESVDLPHDWAIPGPLAADNPTGSPGGFFPAGVGWYRKTFPASQAWAGKHVTIQFDGVYMLSDVWLNGQKLGTHAYGYTPFRYDLTPHLNFAGSNTIAVRVDNSHHINSRWYSGSGIYRHVWLDVREPLQIVPDGIFVKTEDVSAGSATLAMSVTAEYDAAGRIDPHVDFATQIFEVGADGKPIGHALASFAPAAVDLSANGATPQRAATIETRATLPNPKLWSPDSPSRYVVVTTASSNGRVVDTRVTPFGVRTISASAEKGLLLNGQHLVLYGGCVHDDNGPLGVAAFDRAEARRAEILKAAGFNAVRCAHNPPAPAFLDACDRLGLLVIDEAFDCWELGKNVEDYNRYFKDCWQSDLDAIIRRDRNHPSVLMWSIGNEIPDFGSAQGLSDGTMLIARAHELDPTRPVTAAVNWWKSMGGRAHDWQWNDADALMSQLDIVGYNYQIRRYDADHQRMPSRVICSTESYPRDYFACWAAAVDRPYVLGDFVWTAMDYLGESGIGRTWTPDEKIIFHAQPQQFPYHGAICGDIDITGFRKPISHVRNIVWDRGEKLYTSVTEPTPDGRPIRAPGWGVIPSRASWTWPGYEGKELEVQVCSRYDAVRLYLNDKLIDEKPTTRAQKFAAIFRVPYAPGALKTVGVQNGSEVESSVLRTVGPAAALRLTPDRTTIAADGQDLSFVIVEAVDKNGDLQPNVDQLVTFSMDGPATLAGVASGDMSGTDGHQGNQRRLFHGRAELVLRSTTHAGTTSVRATADGLANGRTQIVAK
jgi:beta-galactosidase